MLFSPYMDCHLKLALIAATRQANTTQAASLLPCLVKINEMNDSPMPIRTRRNPMEMISSSQELDSKQGQNTCNRNPVAVQCPT